MISTKSDNLLPIVKFSDIVCTEAALTRVEGLIAESGLSLIFGPSNSGKTFFCIHLACCLAMGSSFFCREVKQCPVVYIAAESSKSVARRLVATKFANNLSDKDVPLFLITFPIILYKNRKNVEALIKTVKEYIPDSHKTGGLIFIDTLSMVTGDAEQNSATEMGAIISVCQEVEIKTGMAICLVHHSGKDSDKGPRGSSTLTAAVDTSIKITNRVATVVKQRDGEQGAKMAFDLKMISIGDDQKEVPVLVEKVTPRDAEKKLSGRTSEVFDILKKISTEGGGPVTKKKWREALKNSPQFLDAKKQTISGAFKRAIIDLSSSKRIDIQGGQVAILK